MNNLPGKINTSLAQSADPASCHTPKIEKYTLIYCSTNMVFFSLPFVDHMSNDHRLFIYLTLEYSSFKLIKIAKLMIPYHFTDS